MARVPRLSLAVHLNSRRIGLLARAASGAVDFRYDADWLLWEHAMPVSLSLPLREDRYLGDRVLAVFDNLLPDNPTIRSRLAETTGASGNDTFSLLAAVGRDCVGALQFLPPGVDPGPAGAVAGHKVSTKEIGALIGNLANNPLGADDDFRISIAGAHEKTALLRWHGAWMIPAGSTATTHILKPVIGRLQNGIDLSLSVENEYLCMKLTAAFGLPVANCEIAEFAGHRCLVVERFDRRETRDGRLLRIPQEDLCQALSVPSARKYEFDGGPGNLQVMDLLRASETPEADRASFLSAQLLFWLLAVTAGHAKNFSIQIAPGGRFKLAPLYDILSAQPSLDAGEITHNKAKLAMAIGDRRHDVLKQIHPRHFRQTAKASGYPVREFDRLAAVILERAGGAIEATTTALPRDFPQALAASIIGGLKSRLIILERYLAKPAA